MAYSEGNSYEEILERCLSNQLLSKMDKRQGSIIYDTLAPLCLELAEAYIKMDIMEEQTYLLTATGSNLDRKVYDYGIVRETATQAERVGIFKRYLLNNSNEYVYAYEYVGTYQGDYDVVDDEFEYVGDKNGAYLQSDEVYNYAGTSQGSYTLEVTYVGANKGSYLYNPNSDNPIYVNVGLGKGNYDVEATNVGAGNGDYSKESGDYGLIGAGRGDYNPKYEKVEENQGSYVRGEKMLVDLTIPIGSRFSLPSNSNMVFQFKEVRYLFNGKSAPYDAYENYNILECESAGTGGNSYVGTILPLTPVIGLVVAEIGDVVTSARDDETDDELRTRTQERLNNVSFGGNIADYIDLLEKQDGVGAAKVFPAYVDENQAVMSFKTGGHQIVSAEVSNIGIVVKLHAQYSYVGTGNGSYTLSNNEYTNVGSGNGDYELITGSYPITDAKKLDFDGGVKIYVLDDEFNPLNGVAISSLQEKIDPTDQSGDGVGLAPIGHHVTITTPTDQTLAVSLYIEIDNSSLEVETPKVKEAIINYVNSIRARYSQKLTLTVYRSDIITWVKNACPNVKDVRNVTLDNENVDYVSYANTVDEQKIPKTTTSNITVNEIEET